MLKAYPVDYGADGQPLVDAFAMQTDNYKNLGAFIAMPIAWIIERRFIKFSVDGSTKTRIIRGVIGTAIVGVLYVVALPAVLNMFLDDHWAHFVKYFILVFLVLVIYPALFTVFERSLKNL